MKIVRLGEQHRFAWHCIIHYTFNQISPFSPAPSVETTQKLR